ncbi:pheophytinase, chloroplastic [Aristolochia californica]|uniref:pheophytinase, chloroplastic n=1 Tax=Aristolochia californica TaxID=171875 RepID=UPI0035D5A166
MELLSICRTSSPCCLLDTSNWKHVERGLNLNQSKLFAPKKTHFLSADVSYGCRSVGVSSQGQLGSSEIQNIDQREGSSLLGLLKGFPDGVKSYSSSENCNYYVADEIEDLRDVSDREDIVTRVRIPALPDESESNRGSPISSCFWEWKPNFTVHYEKSGMENVNAPAVVFLPGFGVGSFHYEKQLKDLGREFRVWALDFLGQGMSLPSEDPAPLPKSANVSEEKDSVWGFGQETVPWAAELVYSIDLWRDQVRYFIEQVIGEPVYIVGNSLGGYVALYFAACNPQLVRGVTLLNATPFWGFLPNPTRSPRLAKIFPWAGTFPLPSRVKKLVEAVWQKISDPKSIHEILKQVYADHSTKVDKVFLRILDTAQHPAAAASFASIMFAPKGELSFEEALSRCQMENIPICLIYGKEDPWVKPFWGQKVKQQVPEAGYYEISPAGHCPHDEVPEVVNFLLRGWIRNLETEGSVALPLLDDPESVDNGFSRDLEFVRDGSRKSVRVRFFGNKYSILDQMLSFTKSWMEKLRFTTR